MSLGSNLRTHLLNNAGVSALINTRVYPMRLPQGYTLPAIAYQKISGERVHDMSGPLGRSKPRVQVDCWDSTYSGARTLADKVRISLDGFKGTFGTMTNVGGIHLMGDRDDFNIATEEYRVILDFLVPHFETI